MDGYAYHQEEYEALAGLQKLRIDDAKPWGYDEEANELIQFEETERERQHSMNLDVEPLPEDTNIYITTGRSNGKIAEKVHTVPGLPEYPETSPGGVAYCVDISGIPREKVFASLKDTVQYCISGRNLPHNKPTASVALGLLDKGSADRHTLRCTGVFACQWRATTVSEPHLNWTAEDWDRKYKNTHIAQRVYVEEARTFASYEKTIAFYNQIREVWETSQPCARYGYKGCLGHPVLVQCKGEVFRANGASYSVCCSEKSAKAANHWAHFVTNSWRLNIHLLKELLESGYQGQPQNCFVTFANQSRTHKCGVPHPQGCGDLEHISCPVMFEVIIPKDVVKTPYALWVSYGIHAHQPPPPRKTPQDITNSLIAIIRRVVSPTTTTSQFIISGELQSWLRDLKKTSLGEIHPSLACRSKISALVRKEQLLMYPEGLHIAGLSRERHLDSEKDSKDQYIRDIYADGSNTLVICFFDELALLLLDQDSFQVDMSFKRIAGDINEILFVGYTEEFQSTIVFVRVFMNNQSRAAYQFMFKRVFLLLECKARDYNKRLEFQHIHNAGIGVAVADMDTKQAGGWGDYLHEHYPQFSSEWHCQVSMMWCLVHFSRGIDSSKHDENIKERMKELPYCDSDEEYSLLCDMISYHNKDAKAWADHKAHPSIRAGLNPNCFKGDVQLFLRVRQHTNNVESAHHMSNQYGIDLSIVGGVHAGKTLDARIRDTVRNFRKGIRPTYKRSDAIKRFGNAIKLSERRREKDRLKYDEDVRQAALLLNGGVPQSDSSRRPLGNRGSKRLSKPKSKRVQAIQKTTKALPSSLPQGLATSSPPTTIEDQASSSIVVSQGAPSLLKTTTITDNSSTLRITNPSDIYTPSASGSLIDLERQNLLLQNQHLQAQLEQTQAQTKALTQGLATLQQFGPTFPTTQWNHLAYGPNTLPSSNADFGYKPTPFGGVCPTSVNSGSNTYLGSSDCPDISRLPPTNPMPRSMFDQSNIYLPTEDDFINWDGDEESLEEGSFFALT